MNIDIKRGDIVDVDLRGAEGCEKKNDETSGGRPCIIIQNDVGNTHSPLTIVAPLTDESQFKNLPIQVKVSASELGFSGAKDSVVECGHLRTIDRDVRIRSHRGSLDSEALKRVDTAILVSLGLPEAPTE